MRYGSIAGVGLPVSRLVMGVDNETSPPLVWPLWDLFLDRGGNCFDTAFIYGQDGAGERALGEWIGARNIRSQVVILDKGAHSPDCNPSALTTQHRISLDRLQTDYVDIYMLHRDNPEIPVGEFADVLHEHVGKGSMKAIGASNWSLPRAQAFNDWARDHGKTCMAAISNNFSLARMVNILWAGCMSSSDPESRAWFTKTQMPLMPWSSQARGFFLDDTSPENHNDGERVGWWYSDDNFQRLARAREMAAKKSVLPINIALAYVLSQPFPTFPLIGPRTIDEFRTSLVALDVALTPHEINWLNLEL